MTETQTLEELAREAAGWFETAERSSSGDRFTRLRDGAPEWLTELARDAHGEMLPDDWRYEAIRAAVDAIADDGEELDPQEWADGYVDVYTSALLEWAGSNLRRLGYVDEAREELGRAEDVEGELRIGQYMEAREVFESVRQSLEAELSARELDELVED